MLQASKVLVHILYCRSKPVVMRVLIYLGNGDVWSYWPECHIVNYFLIARPRGRFVVCWRVVMQWSCSFRIFCKKIVHEIPNCNILKLVCANSGLILKCSKYDPRNALTTVLDFWSSRTEVARPPPRIYFFNWQVIRLSGCQCHSRENVHNPYGNPDRKQDINVNLLSQNTSGCRCLSFASSHLTVRASQ